MSADTIRVGDLVMVVKPTLCCGNSDELGQTFYVKWIGEGEACNSCNEPPVGLCADDEVDSDGCTNIYMLKKINPPPVKESIETKDEVTA